MDFRAFLNLFEAYEQLDEDLGALRNLNAGDLINVFRQTRGGSVDAKFPRVWGGSIGQNSEQINIGKINSWKDLRKAIGRGNEQKIMGAVFYCDGKAFAAANLGDSGMNLYSPSQEITLAFDPSKLPEREQEPEPTDRWSKEYSEWQKKQLPPGTAKDKRHSWEDKVRKFAGQYMEIRKLDTYIDGVIANFPGHEFTCVALTVDKQGNEKNLSRQQARSTDDELAKRQFEKGALYGSDRNKSLKTALDKYKASKNFNTFEEPEEVLDFVSDMSNYGQNFVYKGKQYKFDADSQYSTNEIKIKKSSLIKNNPIEFTVDYRVTNPNDYGYVTVTYRFEDGQFKPVAVK